MGLEEMQTCPIISANESRIIAEDLEAHKAKLQEGFEHDIRITDDTINNICKDYLKHIDDCIKKALNKSKRSILLEVDMPYEAFLKMLKLLGKCGYDCVWRYNKKTQHSYWMRTRLYPQAKVISMIEDKYELFKALRSVVVNTYTYYLTIKW